MKWIFVGLASIPGSMGGALISYLLVGPAYLFYAQLNPVDPSTECARGGGIAWLSILGGAFVGMVVSTNAVLRQYK